MIALWENYKFNSLNYHLNKLSTPTAALLAQRIAWDLKKFNIVQTIQKEKDC